MTRVRVTVLSLVLAACHSPTAPTVEVNEQFSLAPGETAIVRESLARVRFLGVQNDSRCPMNALCIQQGDATVRLDISGGGASQRTYDLTVNAGKSALHGALTIALEQLQPYPVLPATIQPGDYRATFRVTR